MSLQMFLGLELLCCIPFILMIVINYSKFKKDVALVEEPSPTLTTKPNDVSIKHMDHEFECTIRTYDNGAVELTSGNKRKIVYAPLFNSRYKDQDIIYMIDDKVVWVIEHQYRVHRYISAEDFQLEFQILDQIEYRQLAPEQKSFTNRLRVSRKLKTDPHYYDDHVRSFIKGATPDMKITIDMVNKFFSLTEENTSGNTRKRKGNDNA